MRIGSYRVSADLGHLAFLAAMASFCAWYLLDTWRASDEVENLLLILPGVVIAICLGVVILFETVHISREAPAKDDPAPAAKTPPLDWRIPAMILLLILFVLSMAFIPYDIATIAFVFLSLALNGERRWPVLLAYPVVFSVLVTYTFKNILSLEFPTLLF